MFLLNSYSKFPTNPRYVTGKRLHTINFTADNREKVIVILNSNKAHGHDNISIRMLKICGDTIYKLLEFLNKLLPLECFRLNGKKAILSLVTKKVTNRTLTITAQFFNFLSAEKFLKDSYLMKCLVFFLANNLLAPNQSGFKPGDSCINQLLIIIHEIYSSFDVGFEVRSVFLDISKTFNKVWHE